MQRAETMMASTTQDRLQHAGIQNDDKSALHVVQAIIAFSLSRLVIAGVIAVLTNGGFDAMISGAGVIMDAAIEAQQDGEFSRMKDELREDVRARVDI
jgi:hypothetical protein